MSGQQVGRTPVEYGWYGGPDRSRPRDLGKEGEQTLLERSRLAAPLYQQLMREIRTYIEKHGLQPGDLLPTEQQLQEWYGVSRFTVRKALDELAILGIVERRQGQGTFVALPQIQNRLPELTSFTEDMTNRGVRPGSRLLLFETVRDPRVVSQFPGAPEAAVRFVRLRLANGQPIGIHDTYIPQPLARRLGFTEERLAAQPDLSFYAELERNGIALDFAEQRISAKRATSFEARNLGVAAGAPLITFDRRTFTPDRQLIEIMRAVYLADKYEYLVVLHRHGGR